MAFSSKTRPAAGAAGLRGGAAGFRGTDGFGGGAAGFGYFVTGELLNPKLLAAFLFDTSFQCLCTVFASKLQHGCLARIVKPVPRLEDDNIFTLFVGRSYYICMKFGGLGRILFSLDEISNGRRFIRGIEFNHQGHRLTAACVFSYPDALWKGKW